MLDEDSFQYAIENTQVIRSPQRRIDTFGSTHFRFFVVSELMDSVNQVRVRDGQFHAERPQILTPDYIQQMLEEGFGEQAEAFAQLLRRRAPQLAVVKYGFRFRKTNVTESLLHSPLEQVIGRLNEEVDRSQDPLSAIIQGIDEGWEVSLIKFASDLIESSAPGNMDDWKKRGLF
jgi:hypothetical protein